MEHDPVGLIPALHRCWDLPGQVRQQDQGLWPSPGKQFHGRVAFNVWILWLESHMFAVAGSQKTVQMQRVIPVYCSNLDFSVPKLLICFIWIFFLCIWGKNALPVFFFYCEENLKFSVYRTDCYRMAAGQTLDIPAESFLLHLMMYLIVFCLFSLYFHSSVLLCIHRVFTLPIALLFLLQLLSTHCCMDNMCWISS